MKIIIGAGRTKYKGWFNTDKRILNVTDEKHFQRLFGKRKIDFILAEHVLEHLTIDQINMMIKNLEKYSNENLNIRIAVPDGNNSDNNYINMVKPGGTGDGSSDHKNLFTYKSLNKIFLKHRFRPTLVEYWDETGIFHSSYNDDEKGNILRSSVNDPRNKEDKLFYTSLIVDYHK
ncbi:MAG: hypothetical protein A2V66_06125 [Ignavibacteria bacterium RBG_13_36_8]|nr:MAG: hypothetical protein A2V66_06125 [Ignavibacteria bacterium RBG_13_36_8]